MGVKTKLPNINLSYRHYPDYLYYEGYKTPSQLLVEEVTRRNETLLRKRVEDIGHSLDQQLTALTSLSEQNKHHCKEIQTLRGELESAFNYIKENLKKPEFDSKKIKQTNAHTQALKNKIAQLSLKLNTLPMQPAFAVDQQNICHVTTVDSDDRLRVKNNISICNTELKALQDGQRIMEIQANEHIRKFKTLCMQAIDNAKPALSVHHNWRDYLNKLIDFIAIIADSFKSLRLKTTSEKALKKIGQHIETIASRIEDDILLRPPNYVISMRNHSVKK